MNGNASSYTIDIPLHYTANINILGKSDTNMSGKKTFQLQLQNMLSICFSE